MAMGSYELILFDLDGTLADTADDIAEALQQVIREQGLPEPSREKVVASIGSGARKLIERCAERNHEAVLAGFLERYGNHLLDRTRLYAGVAKTLSKIDAVKVVLSNKPTAMCRRMVAGLGIASHFSAVYGGDAFPERKPDPAVIRRVRETFPGRALLVGDSGTDVETARAAGIPIIAVTYGYHRPGELEAADHRIDSICDLMGFLG